MINKNLMLLIMSVLMSVLVVAANAGGGKDTEPSPPPRERQEAVEESEANEAEPSRFAGTVPAPVFPAHLEWINVTRPLTWKDLRGKVVVLDFWTYGCINCIHMIPILDKLKSKYPKELIVVGVHSAKFETEGETGNIRQIVRRYGREEPVVNDGDFSVWRSWGARAWPTIAIVDPAGNVVAMDSGEIPFDVLDTFIGNVIRHFDGLNLMDRKTWDLTAEVAEAPETLLLYPGKVLISPDRIFIADSNHNRIVVATLDGNVITDVIGTGEPGFVDGTFAAASFRKPQGMALVGDNIYVADLDNHALRRIDLRERTVSTVAGTGSMGRGSPQSGQPIRNLREYSLRSPWDVEYDGQDTLFIAMAGTHQIWKYSMSGEYLQPAVVGGSVRVADVLIDRPSGPQGQSSGRSWGYLDDDHALAGDIVRSIAVSLGE